MNASGAASAQAPGRTSGAVCPGGRVARLGNLRVKGGRDCHWQVHWPGQSSSWPGGLSRLDHASRAANTSMYLYDVNSGLPRISRSGGVVVYTRQPGRPGRPAWVKLVGVPPGGG